MNTMDMIGDDFLLLGRMLYTLGIVVHSAQHAPVSMLYYNHYLKQLFFNLDLLYIIGNLEKHQMISFT